MRKDQLKFKMRMRGYKRQVLGGSMLAIDPGSNSLGWAWYINGELVISGEYKATAGAAPHKRLTQIMEQLSVWTSPDILVIEELFSRCVHSLVWSVGAAIVTTKPKNMVEVPIKVWHDFKPMNYTKTDELDALLIGKAAIYYASTF